MADWGETRQVMTPEELHLLRDLFQQACGFVLRDDLKFVAERRLAPRLEAIGLRDFAAYHRYLRFDPRGRDELETAIDLLVPHETYFFREPAQLESFSKEILPDLEARNAATRSLRLWSAGCSTGEEAYTLSMLIAESGRFTGWDVDVLGSDQSRKALTAARKAEYGTSALRSVTAKQRATFFEPVEGQGPTGRVRVKAQYRSQVRFGQLNLLDPHGSALLPRMDAIFCRNVLIYFDVETRRRLVDVFFGKLREGGYLLLGHSENLLSLGTRFELVQLEGDLVYRRPRQ